MSLPPYSDSGNCSFVYTSKRSVTPTSYTPVIKLAAKLQFFAPKTTLFRINFIKNKNIKHFSYFFLLIINRKTVSLHDFWKDSTKQ